MSDTPPQTAERTMQQVNQEYTSAVARLGEIDYMVEKQLPHERQELHKKIHNLTNEAQRFKKKADEVQAKKMLEDAAKQQAGDQNDSIAG